MIVLIFVKPFLRLRYLIIPSFCFSASEYTKKPNGLITWSNVLAIFIGAGGCALALKWYGYALDNRAIVLSDEIEVRAGTDPGDTALFKIHEGAIVFYERTEGNWGLLHLSEDKRGWAEANQLERIVK